MEFRWAVFVFVGWDERLGQGIINTCGLSEIQGDRLYS
jgi:hypothetical protein